MQRQNNKLINQHPANTSLICEAAVMEGDRTWKEKRHFSGDVWKLKLSPQASTRQTDEEELVTDCFIAACRLHLGHKAALERTVKTTADSHQPPVFYACMRGK